LTARPKGSISAVKKFMESLGLKGVEVVALQSSDPMDKARWIEKNLEGVDDVEFTDDSSDNVAAVATLKGKAKGKFQMNNVPHPGKGDYEGEAQKDVFVSDAPTKVKVEMKERDEKAPSGPSDWWKNQTPKFQDQYCDQHPASQYCEV
jgi:hypothetical protein